jgi:hypothetical protein
MTTTKTLTPLREVLYRFSLSRPIPDAELLDAFIRRYPEYAAEITDFAIEVAVDAALGDEDAIVQAVEPTVSPVVSRAMSRFQNHLFAARRVRLATPAREPTPPSVTENPFAVLDRTAFRRLAARLNANTVFVAKLRDRQIDPDTMTTGFRKRVAEELGVPLDVTVAHFAAQAEGQAPQFYKAEQKPVAIPRQSFEDAVRSSGLTVEQQRYLMSL